MSIEKSTVSSIFLRAYKKASEITGLKQKEIAEVMGVSPGAINVYVRGRREPSLAAVIKIAAAFGYDIVDFLALGRDE